MSVADERIVPAQPRRSSIAADRSQGRVLRCVVVREPIAEEQEIAVAEPLIEPRVNPRSSVSEYLVRVVVVERASKIRGGNLRQNRRGRRTNEVRRYGVVRESGSAGAVRKAGERIVDRHERQ